MVDTARDEGREAGREEGVEQVARNLKAAGMPITKIAKFTGLIESDIKNL